MRLKRANHQDEWRILTPAVWPVMSHRQCRGSWRTLDKAGGGLGLYRQSQPGSGECAAWFAAVASAGNLHA